MDVRFINPFVTAVNHLFRTMLGGEVIVSKPVLKDPGEPAGEVTAIIGLSGDALGCVALCFPMPTAVKAASKFAGVEMDSAHEDFSDALGELANIVAGQAKAKFEGMKVGISLPSVVIGKDHIRSQSRHAPRLCIPCDSSLGRFTVEVAILVNRSSTDRKREQATAGAAA
jgi:chemotaxis protein CheX